ncbi:MAG: LytTR family DNA-binding domain-containing protein [Coprococcus sp.]
MKYTINQIKEGEEEVIINCYAMSPEIERLLKFLNGGPTRLIGWNDKKQMVIEPESILYIESVEGKIFAYTDVDVIKLDYTLFQIEEILCSINFFRCSKSMIINIDMVASLRSLPSNRIDAMMKNGEHIMISRTYASDFRKRLKGDANDV